MKYYSGEQVAKKIIDFCLGRYKFIFISGNGGSGKTTLSNSLVSEIKSHALEANCIDMDEFVLDTKMRKSGKKAEEGIYRSVDLIFERDGKTYVVGIKSGPNWGNSDQVNTMKKNLRNAKKLLRAAGKKDIISVNGCMYGRDNVPHKVNKNPDLSYCKICGQAFWELVSGDDQLYKKIIQPLDKEAKKRDEVFKELYVKKINEMTKDVVDRFYTKDNLDWDKIIDYVSKK